jgi:Putative papain-like cysteine peptidase (DUF1796)
MLIPLGNNCCVAYQLQKHGYRSAAYPFDWSKHTMKQLIQVLQDRDETMFTTFQTIRFSDHHPSFLFDHQDSGSYLLTNTYGMQFAHEVCRLDQLNTFQETMKRRFQRFFQLSETNEPLHFLWFEHVKKTKEEEILKLLTLLHSIFPSSIVHLHILYLHAEVTFIENEKKLEYSIHFLTQLEEKPFHWTCNSWSWSDVFTLIGSGTFAESI